MLNMRVAKKEQEADELWRQVRQAQNATAAAAREYRDVRDVHKATVPSETASERYQHRLVQKDLHAAREMADAISKQADRVVLRETENVAIALEGGVALLAAERVRLLAQLDDLNGQVESMQSDFEQSLAELDQQRRGLQSVTVA